MKLRGKKILCICVLLFTLFLGACGIETFSIIYPIPQSNISQEMNNRAVVRIPNDNAGDDIPFENFEIFYRIYVSDMPQSSISESTYPAINATLVSDYNTFKSYINSTTTVNTNMDTVFQGRRYRYLYLQDGNRASSVLTSSVLGTSIVFDFSSSKAPTMIVGSSVYTLWRADSGGGLFFNPQPDRLFRNREELYKSDNINDTINADVVGKSGVTEGRLYTYAAMFIVAVGVNVSSYSNIYSTPALIHVFQLPD